MLKVLGEDSGKFKAVASGTLPNGKPVVVNSDGTVSAVSATGGGAAAGTPAVFEESNTKPPAATYDSANGKVVIAYTQASGSYYGYAVVGTVSGNSITFGTPVLFKSTGSFSGKEPAITFDSNSGKVVVAYYDEGSTGYGLAKVGTVSGTSISFGSAATFESANVSQLGATFDSTNNKVVITYQDDGNSGYGTAVVGTVSGTSITFGTPAVFESAASPYTSPVFDTNNGKVVISYRDNGNSLYGTSVVGTVSGTSISFGTPVVFESANSTYISSVFDSGSGKIITSYVDNGNLSYGTAVVGTVSGTSISFGTPVVFSASDTTYTSLSYDTANDLVSVSYRDNGNSNYGTVALGTVSGTSISFDTPLVYNEAYSATGGSTYDTSAGKIVTTFFDNSLGNWGSAVVISSTSTNLTAENYIGISSGGAVADTGNATVDIIGAVNKDQTGLTAGEKYYVQTDGTLSTTAGDPSVLAGTAISATKLVVKT